MKKLIIGSFVLAIFLSACHHQQATQLTSITDDSVSLFQDLVNKQIDSLKYPAANHLNLLQTTATSSDQENFWKLAFKDCYSADDLKGNTLFNKQLLFLGPSNRHYLGSIYDNDARFRTDLRFLSEKELEKLIDTGASVNSCTIKDVRKIDPNFLIGAGLFSSVNANVTAAISNSDSVIVTGGTWRKDVLRIDDFLHYTDSSSNQQVKDYKASLDTKNHKVVTVVIKVSGFTATAYLNKSLTAGLQASLNSKLTAKIDSAKVSLNLKSTDSRQIDISSTNSFYIFVNLYTEKSLKH